MQVEEGSAKPGRDFTHSTAGLIQFDPGLCLPSGLCFTPSRSAASPCLVLCFVPGVSVKTWNVYLTDDGLEENHETFTVILKNPKNAVLGQRTSASVEIIDPRGGEESQVICGAVHLQHYTTSSPTLKKKVFHSPGCVLSIVRSRNV